ncbi:hypothetical protein V8C44DRAFT_265134 [Trichoderma aethiopicum]
MWANTRTMTICLATPLFSTASYDLLRLRQLSLSSWTPTPARSDIVCYHLSAATKKQPHKSTRYQSVTDPHLPDSNVHHAPSAENYEYILVLASRCYSKIARSRRHRLPLIWSCGARRILDFLWASFPFSICLFLTSFPSSWASTFSHARFMRLRTWGRRNRPNESCLHHARLHCRLWTRSGGRMNRHD